jgi:hypothetical protein
MTPRPHPPFVSMEIALVTEAKDVIDELVSHLKDPQPALNEIHDYLDTIRQKCRHNAETTPANP